MFVVSNFLDNIWGNIPKMLQFLHNKLIGKLFSSNKLRLHLVLNKAILVNVSQTRIFFVKKMFQFLKADKAYAYKSIYRLKLACILHIEGFEKRIQKNLPACRYL